MVYVRCNVLPGFLVKGSQGLGGFRVQKGINACNLVIVIDQIGQVLRLGGHFVQLQVLGNQHAPRNGVRYRDFHPLPVFFYPFGTVNNHLFRWNAVILSTVPVQGFVHSFDKIHQGEGGSHVRLALQKRFQGIHLLQYPRFFDAARAVGFHQCR